MTTLKLRLFGAAATLALVSACSGSTESDRTSAPDTEAAQSSAPAAQAALPGKLGVLQQALAKVNLRPEQKTEIDKLVAEAAARHENVSRARNALKNAVATQLEAGNYDRAALSSDVTALENAIKQTAPADRAGLMRLHAILDSAQRNQLVDAFKELRHAKQGMKGEGPGRGGHGFMKARQWARDLSLSEQQIDTIKGAMRDKFRAGHEGKRGEGFRRFKAGKQLFESFRSDTFTLDENTFPAERQAHGATRLLDVLDVAVPTLTPEQRKLAAQKLRATDL